MSEQVGRQDAKLAHFGFLGRARCTFVRCLAAAIAWLLAPACADKERQPDILIVVVDALRADHLGCYGYGRPTSPHIDEFAKGAMVFDNAIAASSWTKPSIPSLLTGLYPSQHGVFSGNHDDEAGSITSDVLMDRHETLAEDLHTRGYRTAAFVQNAQLKSFLGFSQGFERYVDDAGSAKEIIEQFLQWIAEEPDRPAFAYLHLLDVHWPYQPPPPYDTRFGNTQCSLELSGSGWRTLRDDINAGKRELAADEVQRMLELYDGAIAVVDEALSGLFARLPDPCFVLLTADHGEELYEKQKIGHGHSLSETLLRVPFICRGPGIGAAGRTQVPVSLVDVYPTLIDLAGGKPQPDRPGQSLLAMEATHARRALIAETRPGNDHMLALRSYPHKLVRTYKVRGHKQLREELRPGLRVEAEIDTSQDPWRVGKLTIKQDQQETGVELRSRIERVEGRDVGLLHVQAVWDEKTRFLTSDEKPAQSDLLQVGRTVELDGDFAGDLYHIKRVRAASADELGVQIEARIASWSLETMSLTLARHAMELTPTAALKDRRPALADPKGADRYRVLYHPQNLLARRQLEIVEQLYEVAVDPQESNDLAATMPEVADVLGKLMQRYLEDCAKTATLAAQKTLDPATIEQLRGIGYVK